MSEDCDGGGVPDECEFDCNANGIADSCDLTRGTSDDCNNDGVPDECQPNHDRDCNGNGQPDLCDLYLGAGRDCNDNLTLDECDISEGASEDCSGNGLPDECERDCNDNGIADSCDIVSGTSTDLDGDAVPDECVLGFSLVPIGATKPHLIEDRTIFVIGGGERVTFEIRVSGWDPDQDGDPRLRTYQAAIDVNGYTSGQTGSLSRARITCSDNDDCIAATECLSDGYCEPAAALAIDESHLLFVFAGKATVSLSDPSRNRLGSTVFFAAEAPIDPGSSRYVGTVILDVSPDALGTFTIPFNPLDTFLRDNSDMPGSINIPGFRPAYVTIMPDCNENGVPDARDILDETSGDCDGNGVPDECVPVENDCNDNRLPDVCDIAEGVSEDCNKNGIPDECIQFELDCNHNNAPDRCDIDRGDSPDCNDNNIPDECMALEDDCNENNIPDACDIIDGTSNDCDQSGVPDSCEIDCNGNGFADSCDIADGVSLDRDENGVPDECQTVLWVPFEFATIQDAIDAADNGDVVRVADGVYSGDGNRDIDLSGKVVSVLSANGPANCIIDATGGQTGFVLISGETSSTRVEGFTITNASIAGIVVFEGSPIIRNCIITGNGPTAGGIYCDRDAAPLIEHCVITENSSSWEGGGVRSVRSSPRIRYCTISRNIARLEGGGIYAFSGSMTVTHTTIADNVGREGGGGIAVRAGQPVIRSCRILGNLASSGTGTLGSGGGIMTVRTDATIASSLIAGNYARAFGGGIYLEDGDPTVTNCTIVGNVAESYGGGVHRPGGLGNQWACCHSDFCEDALTHAECAAVGGSWYPAIRCVDVECGTTSCCLEGGECRNMDFFTCAADGGNPGFNGSQCVLSDCTPTISNSVLWDNEAQIGSEIYSGILPLGVVNSTVRNGWSGADNVDTDPGFLVAGYWDEEDIWIDGDYHLDPASDGVDSGDNGAVPPTVVADLDGHPRILCNRVDRGAYERGIGDFNCDQRIDLDDFRYWVNCITGPTGGDYASGCQSFDFDADGDVDLSDFGAYQLETRN